MNIRMDKILEVKVRPFSNPSNQERPDQKGASRIHLCRDALLDLKIDSGQPCLVWRTGEEPRRPRMATAWLTSEKSLSRKVAQVSKSFQDAVGLKLGDDLSIARAAVDSIEDLVNITVVDVTRESAPETQDLDQVSRGHWEWFLAEHLGRCRSRI